MTYKKAIYMCAAIIIAVIVLYKLMSSPQLTSKTTVTPSTSRVLTSQTSEGNVTVEVTPKNLTSGSQVQFNIQFNTHSVELNYDLAQTARLNDDTGNSYKPLSWTGGKGGHHVEGVLTFSAISNTAKKVTLTLPGIDSQDRIFSWEVK